MQIRILEAEEYQLMLPFVTDLNPKIDPKLLSDRLEEIKHPSYNVAGVFENEKLIAICGMLILTKIYTGKQMEIDSVAVDPSMRSKKIGNLMMQWVYDYAKDQGCTAVELNAYVTSSRSHKFWFNEGFKVLGFHMQRLV